MYSQTDKKTDQQRLKEVMQLRLVLSDQQVEAVISSMAEDEFKPKFASDEQKIQFELLRKVIECKSCKKVPLAQECCQACNSMICRRCYLKLDHLNLVCPNSECKTKNFKLGRFDFQPVQFLLDVFKHEHKCEGDKDPQTQSDVQLLTHRQLCDHIHNSCRNSRHCFACGSTFETKSELRTHVRESCLETEFACWKCPNSFKRREFYLTHRHACLFIDELFAKLGDLQKTLSDKVGTKRGRGGKKRQATEKNDSPLKKSNMVAPASQAARAPVCKNECFEFQGPEMASIQKPAAPKTAAKNAPNLSGVEKKISEPAKAPK